MLDRFSDTPRASRMIVALDCNRETALAIARQLRGSASWVKVGMTLFYACGPSIVSELKDMGFRVFLDLKLHDIPAQVHGAVSSLCALGVDMLTIHAHGGVEMARQAMSAVGECRDGSGRGDGGSPSGAPAVLGVTVLTSMDQEALAASGVQRPVQEQVRALAAQAAFLDGFVSSPLEARMLREMLDSDASCEVRKLIVTPGVRLATDAADDQSRIATPAFAFDSGASHIVIGRPITRAADPVKAFEDIAVTL